MVGEEEAEGPVVGAFVVVVVEGAVLVGYDSYGGYGAGVREGGGGRGGGLGLGGHCVWVFMGRIGGFG